MKNIRFLLIIFLLWIYSCSHMKEYLKILCSCSESTDIKPVLWSRQSSLTVISVSTQRSNMLAPCIITWYQSNKPNITWKYPMLQVHLMYLTCQTWHTLHCRLRIDCLSTCSQSWVVAKFIASTKHCETFWHISLVKKIDYWIHTTLVAMRKIFNRTFTSWDHKCVYTYSYICIHTYMYTCTFSNIALYICRFHYHRFNQMQIKLYFKNDNDGLVQTFISYHYSLKKKCSITDTYPEFIISCISSVIWRCHERNIYIIFV